MPGRRRPGTSKRSRRLGCSITTGRGARASTTSIAAASSSCGIGSRGSRRTLTHRDNGGTHDDEENGDEGHGDWREEGRGLGRAKPISHQRRSGKPRRGGGLLRQVIWVRGAKAGGLALLLHLRSGHVASGRRVVGWKT